VDSVVVRSRGTRLAVAGVAALILAADQATKSAALAANPHGNSSGLVSLRLVRNTGAGFGIGSGHPLVIALLAVAILAVAVALLLRTSSRAVALSLAAVVGGAAGNLADRLFRAPGLGRGAVVDWIHVSFYAPTFNLADLAIRLGALIALLAVVAPQLTTRRRTASLASPTRNSAKLLGVVSTTWSLSTLSNRLRYRPVPEHRSRQVFREAPTSVAAGAAGFFLQVDEPVAVRVGEEEHRRGTVEVQDLVVVQRRAGLAEPRVGGLGVGRVEPDGHRDFAVRRQ
jgi:signal peptidase II